MKVALFHPPVGSVTQPYLSTPSLVAYLKQNGVSDVVQYDLSLHATEVLLCSERLMRAYRWCYHYLNKYSGTLTPSEVDCARIQLAFSAVACGKPEPRAVEQAKQVFRSTRFHDAAQYQEALHAIRSGYLLLSARYFPTVISNESLSMRYRLDSSADILAGAEDEDENCFYDVMSSKIQDILAIDGVPDVAGVSINYFEQLIPGLTLARLIKRHSPGTHVALGGALISAHIGKTFKTEFFRIFDSLVFFDGERTLLELVRAIESRQTLDCVPGIRYLQNGRVATTPLHSKPLPINSLPTPDFTGLPLADYWSPEPILPIAGSRGCYWRKCTFCTRQHLFDSYRQRSPARIVEDLKVLHRNFGARAFFFVDECVSPATLRALADEIIAQRLDIRWSCYVRFERQLADTTFCHRLAQSGLRMLYFGLESACDRIIDLMKKGTRKDVISRILEATTSAGIMNMILYFVGFPTETREEALESMQFLLDNRKNVTFALAGHFLLEEHSPVFENPHEFGIAEISPLSNASDMGIVYDYSTSDGMSPNEAQQVQEWINSQTESLHRLDFLNRAHLLLMDH